MKFIRLFTLASVFLFSLAACSSSSGGGPTPSCSSNKTSTPSGPAGGSGANVITVTVDGSECSTVNGVYPNEPCASITLCEPGTQTCQTINDILVDTGSFGLRVFASALTNISLTSSVSCTDGGVLAECVGYGDGSSDWGQVVYADVKLGGEPAVTMPLQLINSNYSSPPVQCGPQQSTPDTSPSEAMFNGIIGIGLRIQDCGTFCSSSTDAELYYSCQGNSCTPATVPLNTQLTNPVALQPTDNNGEILNLPTVGAAGATSVSGTLTLGIGTQTNNAPPGTLKIFTANYDSSDGQDETTTTFADYSNSQLISFLDSGSNQLFIPAPTTDSMPDCGQQYGSMFEGVFCPASTQTYSATNFSAPSGSVSESISFSVANGYNLLNSSNFVFINLASNGGTGVGSDFDWGLPFFLGRPVYLGITGMSSSLGAGPVWAY